MGKTLKRQKKKAETALQTRPISRDVPVLGSSKRRRRKGPDTVARSSCTNRVSSALSAGRWDEAVQVCNLR